MTQVIGTFYFINRGMDNRYKTFISTQTKGMCLLIVDDACYMNILGKSQSGRSSTTAMQQTPQAQQNHPFLRVLKAASTTAAGRSGASRVCRKCSVAYEHTISAPGLAR